MKPLSRKKLTELMVNSETLVFRLLLIALLLSSFAKVVLEFFKK